MFGAISKAAGFLFWGSADAADKEEEKDQPNLSGAARSEVGTSEQNSLGIQAKVTSVHNGYGIINKDIYFAFECVYGGGRPKVGDVVNVLASRKSADDGWKAEQVSVVSGMSWDVELNPDENEAERVPEVVSETVVGMVTRASGTEGVINSDIPFDRHVATTDYTPFRGDWVTCDVERNNRNGTCHATKISPLRIKDFTGEINSSQNGIGFINREIFVQFDACKIAGDCGTRRGEKVFVTAIESNQGKCNWRAISIMKASSQNSPATARLLQMPSIPVSPMQGKFMQALLDDNQDKYGVFVTKSADFGMLMVGHQKSITLSIRNISSHPKTLLKARFHGHTTSQFTVHSPELKQTRQNPPSSKEPSDSPIILNPTMSASVKVDCHTKNFGQEKQLLVFEFEGFKIGRYLTVEVKDPTARFLEPTAPYQRQGMNRYSLAEQIKRKSSGEGWVVPGIRPIFANKNIRLPNKLAQYPVPSDLRHCIYDKEDPAALYPVLKQPLMFSTYSPKFSLLLHLEEIQMEIDIQEYNLERVCLRPVGEFLALRVPGLAEGRPSLIIGDKIRVSEPGEDEGPQYEGVIHEVLNDEVLLKFQQYFHSDYLGQDYNVEFTFNRTPLRRCHQSVNFVQKLGEEILFPTNLELKRSQVTGTINEAVKEVVKSPAQPNKPNPSRTQIKAPSGHTFYNPLLNDRQRAACLRILGGQCRPVPYILFGPPGTGKTVTVVEAVLQVFHHVTSSRTLVCAPSNSAADLLAERLHLSSKISKGDMVRLNAFQRTEDVIPKIIQPYSMYADDLEHVARHRIIVCTCATAGSLYGLCLVPGHFTHAFIDEAGQATEPECLVALGLVANAGGQTVLAGDPLQLGPVLRSKYSVNHGLQESLLERLINRPLYQRDEQKFSGHGCYDPFLVTKLINNYRSHPALMTLPSQLFYHDELQMCADKQMRERLCNIDMLPNPEFPLIFHGIRGEDLREGNSPSWFNPVEAVQVMRYLQSLVGADVHDLSYDDIGIITPYRKQVEKIRLLIDKLDMEKVKVGSVEEFQGQERPVMIISTVRSHSRLVAFDQKFNLGFLSNPKRFNVAITRPQALLIIIGNPHVLAQDPYWVSLLKYCVDNKCYVGCDLPECVKPVASSIIEPAVDEPVTENIGEHALDEKGGRDCLSQDSVVPDIKALNQAAGLIESELVARSDIDYVDGALVVEPAIQAKVTGDLLSITDQASTENSVDKSVPLGKELRDSAVSAATSVQLSQATNTPLISSVIQRLGTIQRDTGENALTRTSVLGSIVCKLGNSPASRRSKTGASGMNTEEVGLEQISSLMMEPPIVRRQSLSKPKAPSFVKKDKQLNGDSVLESTDCQSLGTSGGSDSEKLDSDGVTHAGVVPSADHTCDVSSASTRVVSSASPRDVVLSSADTVCQKQSNQDACCVVNELDTCESDLKNYTFDRDNTISPSACDLSHEKLLGQPGDSNGVVIEEGASLILEEPSVAEETGKLESAPGGGCERSVLLASEEGSAAHDQVIVSDAAVLADFSFQPDVDKVSNTSTPVPPQGAEPSVEEGLSEASVISTSVSSPCSEPSIEVDNEDSITSASVAVLLSAPSLEHSTSASVSTLNHKPSVDECHELVATSTSISTGDSAPSIEKIGDSCFTSTLMNTGDSAPSIEKDCEPCFTSTLMSTDHLAPAAVKNKDSEPTVPSISAVTAVPSLTDSELVESSTTCAMASSQVPVVRNNTDNFAPDTAEGAQVGPTLGFSSPPSRKMNAQDEHALTTNRENFAPVFEKQITDVNKIAGVKKPPTHSGGGMGRGRALILLAEQHWIKTNLQGDKKPGRVEVTSDDQQSAFEGKNDTLYNDVDQFSTDLSDKAEVESIMSASFNKTAEVRQQEKPPSPEQAVIDAINSVYRPRENTNAKRSLNPHSMAKDKPKMTGERVRQNEIPPRFQKSGAYPAFRKQHEFQEQSFEDECYSIHREPQRIKAELITEDSFRVEPGSYPTSRKQFNRLPPRLQKQAFVDTNNEKKTIQAEVMSANVGSCVESGSYPTSRRQFNRLPPRFQKQADMNYNEHRSIQAEVISENVPSDREVPRVNDQQIEPLPTLMSQRQFNNLPPRLQKQFIANSLRQHDSVQSGRRKIEAVVIGNDTCTREVNSQHRGFEQASGSMSPEQYRSLSPSLQKKFVGNVISNMPRRDLDWILNGNHGKIEAKVITEDSQLATGENRAKGQPPRTWQNQFNRMPRRLQRMGHHRFYQWYFRNMNLPKQPDWDLIGDNQKMSEATAITGEISLEEKTFAEQALPGSYPRSRFASSDNGPLTGLQNREDWHEEDGCERSWYQTYTSDWPGTASLGKPMKRDGVVQNMDHRKGTGQTQRKKEPVSQRSDGRSTNSLSGPTGRSSDHQSQQKKRCLVDWDRNKDAVKTTACFHNSDLVEPRDEWVAAGRKSGKDSKRSANNRSERPGAWKHGHNNRSNVNDHCNSSEENNEEGWDNLSGGGQGQFKKVQSGNRFDPFVAGENRNIQHVEKKRSQVCGTAKQENRDIPAFSFDAFVKGGGKKDHNKNPKTTSNLFDTEKKEGSRARNSPGRPVCNKSLRNEGVQKGKLSSEFLEKVLMKTGKVEQKQLLKSESSVMEKKSSASEKKSVLENMASASEKKSSQPLTFSALQKPEQRSQDSANLKTSFDRKQNLALGPDTCSTGAIFQNPHLLTNVPPPEISGTTDFVSRYSPSFNQNEAAPVSAVILSDSCKSSDSDEDYHEGQRDSDVVIESSDEESIA